MATVQMPARPTAAKPATHYDELPGGMTEKPKKPAAPRKRASTKRILPTVKASKSDIRTIAQFIAAAASGFLPLASYQIAHTEVQANPWMAALVLFALLFSAPTLIEWAERWCNGKIKAIGFTVLLEGVMVFSTSEYLAITGLVILMAINCNSAWTLAGKSHERR